MRKKVFKILMVIVCMTLIFSFSMDSGEESSNKSHSLVFQVSEFFLRRPLTEKEKELYVEKYDKPVRKCAHFGIYFLLGLSFISLLKEYEITSWKSVFWTILFVFIYACSDEIHQLFVNERSGQVLDVLLDTFGGSCAAFCYWLRRRKYE